MREYQYPLNLDWTTDEMVLVMNMWDALEQAYEKGIPTEKFLKTHQAFKTVVRSIGEELSGYSLYRTLQEAKNNATGKLKMKG
jgi:uncharacterized protein YktA (UPF0223 family)